LVDIMKNYMANKTFSRGVTPMGAEASFAFVGNTAHNVPYMLKNSDLFEELPSQFHDSAFIDRLHAYLPGWEVDVIRAEMFTAGFGFIVDYLAEILRHLRSDDLSHRHQAYFTLGPQISTRDRDAINKTMSGFMKLLFPAGGETEGEVEELLRLAVESRKRVKDQLKRIDATYPTVDFHFVSKGGRKVQVTTLEEDEYPQFYHLHAAGSQERKPEQTSDADAVVETVPGTAATDTSHPAPKQDAKWPKEGHFVFAENRKGVSFAKLFGPYLKGATKIVVTDPYIRLFYQVRNVMELVETVLRLKKPEDQVTVELITCPHEGDISKQRENLDAVSAACEGTGVSFTWSFDGTGTAHARHIVTDTGWKISLDRGLDIFQQYQMNDAFTLANRLQEQRAVKQFEVTYLRVTP
jgi:ATP-dependent Lon protease